MLPADAVAACDALLGWLVAYLLHSTLLIAVVALLLRVLPLRSNPARETLWTLALFGGVATATVQTCFGLPSPAGTIRIPAAGEAPAQDARARSDDAAADRVPGAIADDAGREPLRPLRAGAPREPDAAARVVPRHLEAAALAPALSGDAEDAARAAPFRAFAAAVARSIEPLRPWLVVAWLGAAILLALSLAAAARIQSRRLTGRVPVGDARAEALLAELCRRAGRARPPRLTRSRDLPVPAAFGVLRPEVCVPDVALALADRQLEALLAHELAHLLRRDPLRLLACRILEAALFPQLLNRLARRRLFDVVEFRCDALAVRLTGRRLALAECLTEVAGWLSPPGAKEAPRRAAGLAMARKGSTLSHRVHRLLEADEVARAERRVSRVACAAFALVPASALSLPAVTVDAASRAGSPEARRETEQRAIPWMVLALEREIARLEHDVAALAADVAGSPLESSVGPDVRRLQERIAGLRRQSDALSRWKPWRFSR